MLPKELGSRELRAVSPKHVLKSLLSLQDPNFGSGQRVLRPLYMPEAEKVCIRIPHPHCS